ncbi:hypothetical protein [Chryseobacterium sp.]|uniref:hypothetical protein n=1 Tax=Chryseobacterium sp. TaxID=1871047 RepID=UPI0025BAFCDE|nr:hypothetical protein [Chryseobacterium sp.]
MEVHKYPVKEGDTLESIAAELGLGSKELKKYHNTNSRPHEWITEDNNLSKWINILYIPDSIDNLKNHKNSLKTLDLVQKEIELNTYSITQKIDLKVSGSSLIDSETYMSWNYKKKRKNDTFIGELEQVFHQVKYVKSIYRALTEYLQKFNKPLEHIVVELSDTGEVSGINNQEEIKDRWTELKRELVSTLGNTLEEKNMLESGDQDFSNTLPLIKNNILYALFFTDLYKKHEINDRFDGGEKRIYPSQIFNNENSHIITKKKVERENKIIKIKLYSENDPLKNSHLQTIYNDKLRAFLQEDCNYMMTWSVEYNFDIETGEMLLCNSKIKEQTGNNYCHTTEYNIELKRD